MNPWALLAILAVIVAALAGFARLVWRAAGTGEAERDRDRAEDERDAEQRARAEADRIESEARRDLAEGDRDGLRNRIRKWLLPDRDPEG